MNSAMDIPVRVKKAKRSIPILKLLVVAALLILGAVTAGFFVFSSLIDAEPFAEIEAADAIVVLTGGEARIPEAVKLLSQGKGKRLLISGVNPITKKRELARLAPNSKKWFQCCIDVDQVARDTIGNADETRSWVEERGFRSLIVVTASYHMPRSLAELRRALPDTDLIPYPVTPSTIHLDAWWTHRGTFQLLAMEYLKFVPAFGRCVMIQVSLSRGVVGGARHCVNASAPG